MSTGNVAILTQPLTTNYGGICQAYALQRIIRQLGFEPWTVDRAYGKHWARHLLRALAVAKRMAMNAVHPRSTAIRAWPTDEETALITQHTRGFVARNLRMTAKVATARDMARLKTYAFGAYVVGSDQVWRPKYSPCLTNYFLDFVDGVNDIRRVAYAASFGCDPWELSASQAARCGRLLRGFDAVSVREDSAVRLCMEHFGVHALHVLDPAMLLTPDQYVRLIRSEGMPARAPSAGSMMVYMLNASDVKCRCVDWVAASTRLVPYSIMPRKQFWQAGKAGLQDCVFPPVSEWLSGFVDAECVVTDSFHAAAFAVLFEKELVYVADRVGGLSRISSLTRLFAIEGRVLRGHEGPAAVSRMPPIDYRRVRSILGRERGKALAFLEMALAGRGQRAPEDHGIAGI